MNHSIFRLPLLALGLVSVVAGCTATTDAAITEPEPVEQSDSELSRSRRVADYPDLAKGLDALATIASGGASLEFFGHTERARKPSKATCKSSSAADAAAEFDKIADVIMEAGNPGDAPAFKTGDLAKTKRAFRAYLGAGTFEICASSGEAGRSLSNVTTILGKGAAPRIALEVGWED